MRLSSVPCRQPGSSSTALTLAVAALLIAGCSDGSAENSTTPDHSADNINVSAGSAAPATGDAAASVPGSNSSEQNEVVASGATVGGDGSAIELAPLSAAEIDAAKLSGELGCGFATSGRAPILVAMGDVASRDAAQGIVKVGDYVERVAAPGGFDAMLKGATFSGKGKTVRIELTGPAKGGGESPPIPATLTYDRADGARRKFAGLWSCGP